MSLLGCNGARSRLKESRHFADIPMAIRAEFALQKGASFFFTVRRPLPSRPTPLPPSEVSHEF